MSITVGDVEVIVEGEGAETILMIHGWPDTHRLWDGAVAALKGQYRCARFTLPGFTDPQATRGWSLEELSALIDGIVTQLCGADGKVILLLHDWGCMIGYQFQARHPERVSKVVGLDVGDPLSLRRELKPGGMAAILGYQLFLAAAWKLRGALGDAMTRFMARRLRYPGDMTRVSSAMCWPYWMVWFGGWRGEVRPFLPECPMFYLYARRKPVQFQAKAWLDALLARPGNQVQAFDTGHWIMLADPDGFAAAVKRWLSPAADTRPKRAG